MPRDAARTSTTISTARPGRTDCPIFVDSAFYIAMIDERDDLHAVAQAAFAELLALPVSFVTSDLVSPKC